MNEPEFGGKTFEWNHACLADFWRITINYEHPHLHQYSRQRQGSGLRAGATVSRNNAGIRVSCCNRCILRCCWRSVPVRRGDSASENEPPVQWQDEQRPSLANASSRSGRSCATPRCVRLPDFRCWLGSIAGCAATSRQPDPQSVDLGDHFFCSHFKPRMPSVSAVGAGKRNRGHWYLRHARLQQSEGRQTVPS